MFGASHTIGISSRGPSFSVAAKHSHRPLRPRPQGYARLFSTSSGSKVYNHSDAKAPPSFLAILCKTAPANARRRSVLRQLLSAQLNRLEEKHWRPESASSRSEPWDSLCQHGSEASELHLPDSRRTTLCRKHTVGAFYFMLGKESLDSALLDGLRLESKLHSDLLMGDFTDSYHRLTRKLLWILHWANEMLSYTYLMVMDDDSFLDLELLLLTLWDLPRTGFYGGGSSTTLRTPVVRQPMHRWYVPKSVYAPDTYPPYHVGVGVVLSTDVVQKCLPFEKNVTQFGVDDAYFGVLLERCQVKVSSIPGILKMRSRCKTGAQPTIVGNMSPDEMERISKSYTTSSGYHYTC